MLIGISLKRKKEIKENLPLIHKYLKSIKFKIVLSFFLSFFYPLLTLCCLTYNIYSKMVVGINAGFCIKDVLCISG